MVRFQTFLLASAALLPSFAYNVKVVNCDAELATNGKDFINDMLADSKILAAAALGLFDDEPPNGKTAEANKNVQPLIPDLFGALSAANWANVDQVLRAARSLANEDVVVDKPTIVVACNPTNEKICQGGTIMETDLPTDEPICDKHDAKSCILLCPAFWKRVEDKEAPRFNHFLSEHEKSIDVCTMKPITLGSSFSARIFYHETIHTLTGQDKFGLFNFKDQGYLVDEDTNQQAPHGIRIMMVQDTFFSQQNPDTYSFWAIMAWRQRTCSWKAGWPFPPPKEIPATFPITTIDREEGKKSVYGRAESCPGSSSEKDGFLTKPTMDVVKRSTDGGKQDLLWCKFSKQSSDSKCPDPWKAGALTVMADGGGDESLFGCFMPVSSQQLSGQEEVGNFGFMKEEIQQEL